MRAPARPLVHVGDVVRPGEGRAEVSHTVSGSAVCVYVETVSGARASLYLPSGHAETLARFILAAVHHAVIADRDYRRG